MTYFYIKSLAHKSVQLSMIIFVYSTISIDSAPIIFVLRFSLFEWNWNLFQNIVIKLKIGKNNNLFCLFLHQFDETGLYLTVVVVVVVVVVVDVDVVVVDDLLIVGIVVRVFFLFLVLSFHFSLWVRGWGGFYKNRKVVKIILFCTLWSKGYVDTNIWKRPCNR